ncbi:vascular cell adhesion protein 1b isoform X1 [Electrophorus electricus]|uniref:vascular cell adhesion protein 1b isoform X1 n=1 Tax=Electrophorus electricus TaxID=8005 RepID=UPI0015CF9274|nr:vascular cell adhesion protein 1b isoform X1 [Electrophorus electricus]
MVLTLAVILHFILPLAGAGLRLQFSPKNALFKLGDRQQLTCILSDCEEDVKYIWKPLEDKPLYGKVISSPAESKLIFSNITKNHENTIICEARCKDVSRQARARVNVYSFPKDPVISGHERLVLGKEAILTCKVSNVYPEEYIKFEWILGDELVPTQDPKNNMETTESFYTFIPQNESVRNVTCRASLELDGLPSDQRTRETTVSMHVLYAPRSVRTSGAGTVQVGSNLSLTCEAEGNPKPEFSWRTPKHAGQLEEVKVGREILLLNVSLSDAGIYECTASNELGRQTVMATVTIHGPPVDTVISMSLNEPKEQGFLNKSYLSNSVPKSRPVLSKVRNGSETELASVETPPRNTSVQVLPSKWVHEGENITICCNSVSFPPPAIVLRKLDGGRDIYSPNGTFLLVNLTANDTGQYQVNVTNALGYETKNFTIHVMETFTSPLPTWNDYIIPATGLGVLASVAGILEYLRRAKRKGIYELSKCRPGTV